MSHKEPFQWPNRAGCSFYGCHALCERQGSKGHGLSALTTHRQHLFIPSLIETPCTTSQLCFGQIKVTILISYLSLHAGHWYAHKSSRLPLRCGCVSPILQYITLHRAIFVQEVHCIFLCLVQQSRSHFSRRRSSQESLNAIKESGRVSALNIDLLSGICQRSTANKPFGGHLTPPLTCSFCSQAFAIRKYL